MNNDSTDEPASNDATPPTIVELLGMAGVEDIEFESERAAARPRDTGSDLS